MHKEINLMDNVPTASLSVFRSSNDAGWNFEQNLERLSVKNRRDDLFVYTDWQNIKVDFNRLVDLFEVKATKQFREEFDTYDNFKTNTWVDLVEFDNVIDDDDLIKWLEGQGKIEAGKTYEYEYVWYAIDQKMTVQLKPSRTIEIIETKGYSQGDYAQVIMLDGMTDKTGYIDNLFWDAPIHVYVNEEGLELEDEYEYNLEEVKTKAIEEFKRQGVADKYIEQLVNDLPEYPPYE